MSSQKTYGKYVKHDYSSEVWKYEPWEAITHELEYKKQTILSVDKDRNKKNANSADGNVKWYHFETSLAVS